MPFRRLARFPQRYLQELAKNGRLLDRRIALEESAGTVRPDVFPAASRPMSPYVFPESIRILGLQWDSWLCFAEHVNNVLSRAKIRHGVMSRLARSTWALEVGALRSSQAALLTSLAGYGLAAYGSGAYEGDLRRLGAQLVNASARRITIDFRSNTRSDSCFVYGLVFN